MAERKVLVRDGAVVRVIPGDVERFESLGYVEKQAPTQRKPAARKPRTVNKDGE